MKCGKLIPIRSSNTAGIQARKVDPDTVEQHREARKVDPYRVGQHREPSARKSPAISLAQKLRDSILRDCSTQDSLPDGWMRAKWKSNRAKAAKSARHKGGKVARVAMAARWQEYGGEKGSKARAEGTKGGKT